MGRKNNSVTIPNGFNITSRGPIDSRTVVDDVSDLYLEKTWNGVTIYDGMTVTVYNDASIYILIDRKNFSNPDSWKKVKGEGGSGDSIISDITDDDGNIIVTGGTVSDVILQLLDKIETLQEQLDNSITNIEYIGIDDDDNNIEVTVSGNTAYIKLNGIG